MKRIEVSSRRSLVLAAVAVMGIAVWAVAAHGPCHRACSPATASADVSVAATPAASETVPASAVGSAGKAQAESPSDICPPCDACPEGARGPAVSHVTAPASAGLPRSGMVVAIDPETGTLGAPSAEQAASLQPKSLTPADEMLGLEEVHHADGSVSVKDLSGRFRQWEIVRRDPTGAVQASCIQGTDEAVAAARDTVARVASTLEVK